MFVQSEHFIEEHQERIGDILTYGQENNQPSWRKTGARRLTACFNAQKSASFDDHYGDQPCEPPSF
jgi:hypothetical protein